MKVLIESDSALCPPGYTVYTGPNLGQGKRGRCSGLYGVYTVYTGPNLGQGKRGSCSGFRFSEGSRARRNFV